MKENLKKFIHGAAKEWFSFTLSCIFSVSLLSILVINSSKDYQISDFFIIFGYIFFGIFALCFSGTALILAWTQGTRMTRSNKGLFVALGYGIKATLILLCFALLIWLSDKIPYDADYNPDCDWSTRGCF
jgi:hypothetical protein